MKTALCMLVCLALLAHPAYGFFPCSTGEYRLDGCIVFGCCEDCQVSNSDIIYLNKHTSSRTNDVSLLTKLQVGRFQSRNSHRSRSCQACEAGQYTPSTGQSSCRSCPAGQFQGSEGHTVRFCCIFGSVM